MIKMISHRINKTRPLATGSLSKKHYSEGCHLNVIASTSCQQQGSKGSIWETFEVLEVKWIWKGQNCGQKHRSHPPTKFADHPGNQNGICPGSWEENELMPIFFWIYQQYYNTARRQNPIRCVTASFTSFFPWNVCQGGGSWDIWELLKDKLCKKFSHNPRKLEKSCLSSVKTPANEAVLEATGSS